MNKRKTATPSPHECSKLIPAVPSFDTISVNDLSNQRFDAFEYKKFSIIGIGLSGLYWESSRHKQNIAESISFNFLQFSGLSSMLLRTFAQVSRFSLVKIPICCDVSIGLELFKIPLICLYIVSGDSILPKKKKNLILNGKYIISCYVYLIHRVHSIYIFDPDEKQ